jgi:hypothetical protein
MSRASVAERTGPSTSSSTAPDRHRWPARTTSVGRPASGSSSAAGASRRSPVHHTRPTGSAAISSPRPPTWSACGWVSTSRSTREMPRARRYGTTTRWPAPTGPTSTTTTAPLGSSSTAASPWPTGKKVARSVLVLGIGSHGSAATARPQPQATARARRARRAVLAQRSNAETISTPPRPAATCDGLTSTAASGACAATRARTASAAAPQPAACSSHAPAPAHTASSTPPSSDSGTNTSEPSGAAGMLASTPTSDTRPKCQATMGSVASVADALARPTARPARRSHGHASTRARASMRAASQGSRTSRPSSAPTDSWSPGSPAQLGRQATRTITAQATEVSASA